MSCRAAAKGSFVLKNLHYLVCSLTGFTGSFENPQMPKVPYPNWGMEKDFWQLKDYLSNHPACPLHPQQENFLTVHINLGLSSSNSLYFLLSSFFLFFMLHISLRSFYSTSPAAPALPPTAAQGSSSIETHQKQSAVVAGASTAPSSIIHANHTTQVSKFTAQLDKKWFIYRANKKYNYRETKGEEGEVGKHKMMISKAAEA